MTSHLKEIMKDPDIQNIVDLQLYPVGEMHKNSAGDDMICSGGIKECELHRYFACFLQQEKKDNVNNPMPLLDFIDCMENNENSEEIERKLMSCVSDVKRRQDLQLCHHVESFDLLVTLKKIEETITTGWFPYVLVNNKVLGNAQEGLAMEDITSAICKSFTGKKEVKIHCNIDY